MTILPLHPADHASPDALRAFLAQCRDAAVRGGQARLVSISLAVEALDPLAVLESIFEPGEPHFYAERPNLETAISGAEVAVAHEAGGPERFAQVQRFVDATLENAIAVGDVDAPFGGPHFFAAFSFGAEAEPGDPFPAARVFVPRWQVARAGPTTTAVANLLIGPDSNLDAEVERVWRAHRKFSQFEYGSGESGAGVTPMGSAGGGGTGILPVGSAKTSAHGQDARATAIPRTHGQDAHATKGRDARATAELVIRQGANLPHWTREGAIYSVTFRLADSLPAPVIAAWRGEMKEIEERAKAAGGPLSPYESERLRHLHSEKIEAFLDSGVGACELRDPRVAAMVAEALEHFHGERYELHEWCVMPNHVHVVFRPLAGHDVETILHSWKSWTTKEANRILERKGEFWQVEYYDHLIRDEAEYVHAIEYVRNNPEKAGLKDWKWVGSGSGMDWSGTGILPVGSVEAPAHGQDARATAILRTHGQDAHATPHGRDARATSIHGQDARATPDYRAAVARALQLIAAGEFEKIVLARAIDLTAPAPLHPLRILNGLRQRFPECYAFSLANGRGQSFIGASPERLLRVSHDVLETEALAGTLRRGVGASEDATLAASLLRSEKDLREHRLVLETIARRLTQLGLRPEYSAQPGLRRLANVQHLHTPVRAALGHGVRLLAALGSLHPTPAVGGAPAAAAIARIRELEGFSRGLYAGAIGWINARGGGEFFVGIRSALVDGAAARVYAGNGVVAGSDPEKEFAETEWKFRAMLDAFDA